MFTSLATALHPSSLLSGTLQGSALLMFQLVAKAFSRAWVDVLIFRMESTVVPVEQAVEHRMGLSICLVAS